MERGIKGRRGFFEKILKKVKCNDRMMKKSILHDSMTADILCIPGFHLRNSLMRRILSAFPGVCPRSSGGINGRCAESPPYGIIEAFRQKQERNMVLLQQMLAMLIFMLIGYALRKYGHLFCA